MSSGDNGKRVTIVGAGLVGALLACYFARAGWRVAVYERRGDPRAKGYIGGRSINLALSVRGLDGLAGVGLDRVVMERDAIAMTGRMIHPPTLPPRGQLIFQPYSSKAGEAINSVSRGGLNLSLIHEAANHENVEWFFDHPCVNVDYLATAAEFQTTDGKAVRVESDLIVGADGAFSAVRGVLMKTDRFEYSQSYLEHGYKELHIPAAAAVGVDPAKFDGWAMDPNALHIWPRGGAMMIALPNRDKTFTCTLFWPLQGEHGLDELKTDEQVKAFFAKHYPDAAALMPTLALDFGRNPSSSLVTVKCWPWARNRTVLVGDAAHAIVPFYGQGMNCGFEDCKCLAECLSRRGDDVVGALEEFQSLRKANADAIAEMALENFVEMRDKVGRPEFLYKKKVEQAVHAMFPQRVTPQYNLVSFSTVPYAEAQRRGRELDRVLERVIAAVPAGMLAAEGEGAWKERVRKAFEEAAAAGIELRAAGEDSARRGNPPPQPSPPPLGTGRGPDGAIDITPALSESTPVWPGDTPLSRKVLMDLAKGDTVTLSTLTGTVHLGAHADGPNHYGLAARSVGEQKLEYYVGPCHVLAVKVEKGKRIAVADVVGGLGIVRHPRVLLKSGTFVGGGEWNSDFAGLSVELVDALAAKGVITIAVDTPSVDLQDSKDLPAHKAILRHDIAIIEGVDLSEVAPGEYELIALPLKLMGFDGSPVRAVLRPLGGA
ncbi:MAG: FAD-dependent monooxygenase [Phycisphaerales bacterium]